LVVMVSAMPEAGSLGGGSTLRAASPVTVYVQAPRLAPEEAGLEAAASGELEVSSPHPPTRTVTATARQPARVRIPVMLRADAVAPPTGSGVGGRRALGSSA
jgi:hypothetical protein